MPSHTNMDAMEIDRIIMSFYLHLNEDNEKTIVVFIINPWTSHWIHYGLKAPKIWYQNRTIISQGLSFMSNSWFL